MTYSVHVITNAVFISILTFSDLDIALSNTADIVSFWSVNFCLN